MEPLSQIPFSQQEEMRISLKEVCRRWHVELRLCGRSDAGSPQERVARHAINLPIEQLPMLLERLVQVRDSCMNRGLLGWEPTGETVVMERGESIVLRDRSQVSSLRARRYPRMPVRHTVICQPVRSPRSPRSAILQGEFRDLSAGGAQIWLPCRLELGQQVEIAGMIDGQPFRARAEVVGAGVQTKKGHVGEQVRHSLKWLTYNAAAADILTMTLVQPAEGDPSPGGSPPGSEILRDPGPDPSARPDGLRYTTGAVDGATAGMPGHPAETSRGLEYSTATFGSQR